MRRKTIHFYLTTFLLLLCGIVKAEDVDVKLNAAMLASDEEFNAAIISEMGDKQDVNLVFSLGDDLTSLTDAQLMRVCQFVTNDKNTARERVTGINLHAISIKAMPASAFQNATYLTSISLPALTSLSGNLFTSCSSLTSLTIGEWSNTDGNTGLEMADVPSGCFQSCGNLTNINIKGVKTIGGWSFSGCTSMKVLPVTLADGANVTISSNAFENMGFEGALVLPEGIAKIEGDAFGSCKSLTSVTLPATVASVNASFVNNCTALQNILVADGNSSYESRNGILYKKGENNTVILVRCPMNNADDVDLSAHTDIAEIAENAFLDCNIKSVTLNSGLLTIGANAFGRCSNLTSLVIPASVTDIASSFVNGSKNLATLTVESGNAVYETVNNITYAKATAQVGDATIDTKSIFRVPEAMTTVNGLIDLSAVEGVTIVGANAFEDVANMTELILPSAVTTLTDGCFKASGLQKFHVPSHLSVSGYGEAPFSECGNLLEFIGDDLDNFTINDGILYNKANTKLFKVPNGFTTTDGTFKVNPDIKEVQACAFEGVNKLQKVIFAQGTRALPLRCFLNSGVKTVIIPNSVTTIGQDVFMGSAVDNVIMLTTTQTAPKTTANNEQTSYNSFYGTNGGLKIHLSAGYGNFKDQWVAASAASATDPKDASRLYGWDGMADRLDETVRHRALFERAEDADKGIINPSDNTNTLSGDVHYDYITLYRDFSTLTDDTYATLALPFNVSKSTLVDAFGEQTKVWQFVGRKHSVLCFEPVDLSAQGDGDIIIKQGVAVLFKPQYKEQSYLLQMNLGTTDTDTPNAVAIGGNEDNTSFGASYVETVDTDNNVNYVNGQRQDNVTFNYAFYATYQASSRTEAGSYYMLSDGSFKYTQNGVKIKKAFRGFIHGNDDAINGDSNALANLSFNGSATGIDGVSEAGTDNRLFDVYNVNGQLVAKGVASAASLGKGLYIVNGKKVVVK